MQSLVKSIISKYFYLILSNLNFIRHVKRETFEKLNWKITLTKIYSVYKIIILF